MRAESAVHAVLPVRGAGSEGVDTPFKSILARILVKAMRATAKGQGPLSGGAGERLFGQVMEETLADAIASSRPARTEP